jgi:glycosyltransferase involved in cell wall biosynthesis
VSACIITRDEEDRLPACLASLSWCDEIVVVDSHSTDATREVAAAHGARVIERDWPGHVAQKEFAIRQASHEHVFCIDADERVSPALEKQLVALRDAGFPGHAGWQVSRVSSWQGRTIRHGTWFPDWKLRLFDRRKGRWGGRDPHDRVEVDGSVGRLGGELQHDPYRSLDDHLATIDRYTTIMAKEMRDEGRPARLRDVILRPPARFLVFYFVRGGWRDGWRGLVLAYLAAHYVRLKYVKHLILDRE